MNRDSEEGMALASVRLRSQRCLGYLTWALLILVTLWTVNTSVQLLERWIAFVRAARTSLGLGYSDTGPDYWTVGAAVFAVLVLLTIAAAAYGVYRSAWSRKLNAVWGEHPSHVTRLAALRVSANPRELDRKFTYLDRLAVSPGWLDAQVVRNGDTREAYCKVAEQMLAYLERHIAARAVTTGLIVGMNRNPLLDTLTIVSSALELQLHVLTTLGKRPSLKIWIELLKRAGASVFINSYVGRDDALYFNLTIRKAALGVEMAADTLGEAAESLKDVDWDEVLGEVNIPGLSTVSSLATTGLSVGAFGLRHIGTFIETTANDLLQGVLAAGALYFHGMALAADCLAVDVKHRQSPEMSRTIAQSMMVACAPAGQMLRRHVRLMRDYLRARRRLAFTMTREATISVVDKLREEASKKWERAKTAGKFLGRG